jgi:hypothetical protein
MTLGITFIVLGVILLLVAVGYLLYTRLVAWNNKTPLERIPMLIIAIAIGVLAVSFSQVGVFCIQISK